MSMKHHSFSTYQMAIVALMAAFLCVLGPIAIPIGTIPISFTNFFIYLTLYLIGTKLSFISCLLYLLLGMIGLPVFSGYSGGLSKLTGPTGGYLIGFLFLILVSGFFIQTFPSRYLLPIIGMLLGMLISYFFGTIWFILEMKSNLWNALTICVFPFLIGDFIKILLAAKIGPILRKNLQKAHLLEKIHNPRL